MRATSKHMSIDPTSPLGHRRCERFLIDFCLLVARIRRCDEAMSAIFVPRISLAAVINSKAGRA